MGTEQQTALVATSIRACPGKAVGLFVAALALAALCFLGVYSAWRIHGGGPDLNWDHIKPPLAAHPSSNGWMAGHRSCRYATQGSFGSSCVGLDGIDALADLRLGALGPPRLDVVAYGATEASQQGAPTQGPRSGSSGRLSQVRLGAPRVSGRLPPEIIERMVRQNRGRLRQCYEAGLRNNPNLQGRVTVRFVVGRDGSTSNIGASGDLPDGAVVSCVARSFYGLSLPEPEAGLVTASYPIEFAPSR